MQKRAPTLANLLVISLFALSCFGLLLFLWESFGGSVPLKPKGYRIEVAFPRTMLLAEESDVRISGVPVGHVTRLKRNIEGRNEVTLEIDHQYAPIRANMHAILRQKTLLGETYVELIPGPRVGPYIPEGGRLPNNQVVPSVTFDDILSALDPKTRRSFQLWQQSLAAGFAGRGEDLNAAFATLNPFVGHANEVAAVAASQEGALTAVIRGTGEVFDALSERDHQLRGLISGGERTFSALAQSSQAFAQVWRELPAFEHNSIVALRSVDSLAVDASPLEDQLRPAEIQLAGLTQSLKIFAPAFNNLLSGLGPLTKAAKVGVPDIKKQLDLTVPLLEATIPFTRNFNPFLEELSRYVPELQALLANATAATQGSAQEGGPTGPRVHYLGALPLVNPDSISLYAQRSGFNRANPYQTSGASRGVGSGGMPVFNAGTCANGVPQLSGPGNTRVPESLIELLAEMRYIEPTPSLRKKILEKNPQAKLLSGGVPAPACTQAAPFTINGRTTQFPQVTAAAK
jgi:phospholipid/cholesterol/gamma-HCH transport system substrate-binding protein